MILSCQMRSQVDKSAEFWEVNIVALWSFSLLLGSLQIMVYYVSNNRLQSKPQGSDLFLTTCCGGHKVLIHRKLVHQTET